MVENLAHAVTTQFMFYNFARPHSSLSDHVWTVYEMAQLLD